MVPEINDEVLSKYLLFSIDELFAIPLENVVEIIEDRPVTRIPETPDYILGIMNLRGSVVSVIDMRTRFKKPVQNDLPHKCIVIIRYEGMQLGLVVDDVLDLITIPKESITPPPQVGGNYSHVFVKAIGVKDNIMTLIIDTDKLIHLDDLAFIENLDEEV